MSLGDVTVFILAGSANAGKVAAIGQAFQEWFDAACAPRCVTVEVEAMATESGVSDQPMGMDETVEGARNRVAALLETPWAQATGDAAPDALKLRFAVALESGLCPCDGALLDVCACAVVKLSDGDERHGQVRVGVSSGFALPPGVARAFAAPGSGTHRDYNGSVAAALQLPPDATGDGLLGALRKDVLPGVKAHAAGILGTLTRPGQMRTAVAMAILQAECSTAYPSGAASFGAAAAAAASPSSLAGSDEVQLIDDATQDGEVEVVSYASTPRATREDRRQHCDGDTASSDEFEEVFPSFGTAEGAALPDAAPHEKKKKKKARFLFGKGSGEEEGDDSPASPEDRKKRAKYNPVSIATTIKKWEKGGKKKPCDQTGASEIPVVVTDSDMTARLRIVPIDEAVRYPWAAATRAQITAQLQKFRATIRSVAGGYGVVELRDGIILGKGMYYSVVDSQPPFPPAYKVISMPQNECADPMMPVNADTPTKRSVMKEVRGDEMTNVDVESTASSQGRLWEIGVHVLCDGLKKSTEINGRRGKILGHQAQGRELLMQCDFQGILKAVKKANLTPVCTVETCAAPPRVRCTNCGCYYCADCSCTCLDDDKRAEAWVKDEASNNCGECGANFTWARRRHHCRACGHLFCGDCTKARQTIPGFSTPQKVCGSCAKSAVSSVTSKQWVRDEDAVECGLCWVEFTQRTRRHHCRACGKVFCGVCSHQKIRVSGYMMPQRVCMRCATSTKKQDDGISFASRQLTPDYEDVECRVTLHGAVHIPKMDTLGSSQVWVRLRARAGKGKWVGKEAAWPVVIGGASPTWHTTRCLGCKMGDVATLEFRLWSKDPTVGDEAFIGDVSAPLGSFKPGTVGSVSIRCPSGDRQNAALLLSVPTHPPVVKNVFFVRHGQSRWNAAKKAGGTERLVGSVKETDHPLSAVGCEQAVALCANIEQVLYDKVESELKTSLLGVQQVYASPLARASQTALIGANAIIRNTGERLTLTRYAREKRNVGGRDTQSSVRGEKVKERIVKETKLLFGGDVPNTVDFDCIDWSQVNVKWWNDSAETKEEFTDRLKELTNMIQYSPYENIMIVGHSHCFRGLVNHLISPRARLPDGVTFSDLRAQKLNNCGMMQCTLDFSQAHPVTTVDLVFDTHLVGKKKDKKGKHANEPDEPDPEDDEEDEVEV